MEGLVNGQSQPSTPKVSPSSGSARLFDLRVLIGCLFTLYGVTLIVAGLVGSAAEIQKASGININLWMGIGMLVLGLLFLLWWRTQPVSHAPGDQ